MCLLLSHKSHKKWNKKNVIWIERKKENLFFLWKKMKLFFITKKKKKKNKCFFFLEEQMFIIYWYFSFVWEERESVYLKLKYLLPYVFFLKNLSKNIFGKSIWTKTSIFCFSNNVVFFPYDCNITYLIIKISDEEFGL